MNQGQSEKYELSRLYNLFDTLDTVQGIGDKRFLALCNLIKSKYIKDLILYKPISLECFDNEINDSSKVGDKVSAIIKIKRVLSYYGMPRYHKNKKAPIQVICDVLNKSFKLVFFNIPFQALQNMLIVGKKYFVIGVLGDKNTILQPKILYEEKSLDSFSISDIVRVKYHLSKDVHYAWFSSIMKHILSKLDFRKDWYDKSFLLENKFDEFNIAIKNLHYPRNRHEYTRAINRLQYDELLSYFLKLSIIRNMNDNMNRSKDSVLSDNLDIRGNLQNNLIEKCGFELTDSQKDVIGIINHEQRSKKAIKMLIQGDVGSGKSIVAFAAILNIVEAGFQSVIMVPTCLLAQQHFDYIYNIFGDSIDMELLLGSTRTIDRKNIIDNVKNGITKVLIGTHILFNDDIEFKNLHLIVIDEQQRFGVKQRLKLFEKGVNVDMIMLTATPIPRSLAQVIYGDIDYFQMVDKPKCRVDIVTTLLSYNKIDLLIERIKKNIANDFKVLWVCPLVEDSEYFDFITVEERFNMLKDIFEDSIEMLYGDLIDNKKIDIIDRFRNGDLNIIVSTTVVETGIDVPNASLIVIENAEHFGLSQLHQLRGRVGRNDREAFCILLYGEHVSKTAIKRLKILESCINGFEIAQKDLELRGSGDILGCQQSGVLHFIFSDDIMRNENINKIEHINLHAKKIVRDNDIDRYSLLISLFENSDNQVNIVGDIKQRFSKMVSI